MTKHELIERLSKFQDADCVIIGDRDKGWSNLGVVKQEGSCICIMVDNTRPFSSDN